MATILKKELQVIIEAVRRHPEGVTTRQLVSELKIDLPLRTLQYQLKYLTDRKHLVKEGERRWAKYRLGAIQTLSDVQTDLPIVFSKTSIEIQNYVRQPIERRTPVGYNRAFLDSYRPNVSSYLLASEREWLWKTGKPQLAGQAAGTYAKQILNRLLIDLSWNSSRLEGNTYSLLDTRRLIDFGEEAQGKERLEAQMIINHKDSIEFLVRAADEIGFNRYTILNLHAMLANNLLKDPTAAGRLRHIAVGIEKSTFHPLEVPALIEECFDQILATATAIQDPFEQAFFAMVHVPYLQPFDDVNKRVSRLAANIPLIKGNLSPLSFNDVPRSAYTEAMLGIYELQKIDLLKEVFIWAYERSSAQYTAVRQSLGEPDPFRLKHRVALQEMVSAVIREGMDRKRAAAHIVDWTQKHIEPVERDRFREMTESELIGLHEGNFARYRIRPSEFTAWQNTWK